MDVVVVAAPDVVSIHPIADLKCGLVGVAGVESTFPIKYLARWELEYPRHRSHGGDLVLAVAVAAIMTEW